MLDYIDVLLRALEADPSDLLPSSYISRLAQEEAASAALLDALDDHQLALFRAYEKARDLCEMANGDFFARRVFLLAREIYR